MSKTLRPATMNSDSGAVPFLNEPIDWRLLLEQCLANLGAEGVSVARKQRSALCSSLAQLEDDVVDQLLARVDALSAAVDNEYEAHNVRRTDDDDRLTRRIARKILYCCELVQRAHPLPLANDRRCDGKIAASKQRQIGCWAAQHDFHQHAQCWTVEQWLRFMPLATIDPILVDEQFGCVPLSLLLYRVLAFFNYHCVDVRDGRCVAPMPMWPLVPQRKYSLADDCTLPLNLRPLRHKMQYSETDFAASFDADGVCELPSALLVGRCGDRLACATGDAMRCYGQAHFYGGYLLHPILLLRLLRAVQEDQHLATSLPVEFEYVQLLANRIADLSATEQHSFVWLLLFQTTPRRLPAPLTSKTITRRIWHFAFHRNDRCSCRRASAQFSLGDTQHDSGYDLAAWLRHEGFALTATGSRVQWLSRDAVRRRAALYKQTMADNRSYDWRQLFASFGCRVAPSTLPGAGRGLFATIDVPTRCTIGMYIGRITTVGAQQQPRGDDMATGSSRETLNDQTVPVAAASADGGLRYEYTMTVERRYDAPNEPLLEVDARSLRHSTLMRFINYANRLEQINVLFDDVGNLVTVRPLRPGDELLTTYGELGDYFKPLTSTRANHLNVSKHDTAALNLENRPVNDASTFASLVDLLTLEEAQQIAYDSASLENEDGVDTVPALKRGAGDSMDFQFRDQGYFRAIFGRNRWKAARIVALDAAEATINDD